MPDRVLVVDDDPALLSLELALLEAHEFEVTTALDGLEAVDKLRNQDFDLVVSDLEMPGLSGLELLEHVKEAAPDTVLIICTSHARVDVAVRSLRAGAFDFVTKPFQLDHFVSVVQRGIDHRRLRDTTNVYQAAQAVFETHDPNDLPQVILDTAARVVAADYAAVFTKHGDGFALTHAHGAAPDTVMLMALQLLSADVDRKRGPIRLPGKNTEPHAMALPLVSSNRLHGVLWVLRDHGQKPFTARELEASTILAAQAALALDNVRLIADLRARIDALEKARRRLYTSARIEGIGRIAIDLAHQIQNPLDYTRTNLRAINAFPDEGPMRLGYAMEGLGRVEQMVSDLASVAQTRERATFELGQVVALAVRMAHTRVPVAVTVEQDAVIQGHPGQFAQAMVALLANADQALVDSDDPVIAVRVRLDGDRATVSWDPLESTCRHASLSIL